MYSQSNLLGRDKMSSFQAADSSSSESLLHAKAHIWNHIFSFINSMSLKCAVELGIPDAILRHGKSITLAELCTALSVPPNRTPNLQRLMSLLVHSGFFDTQEQNGAEVAYSLNHISTLLVKGKETSLAPFLILMLDSSLMNPWEHLSTWFKQSEPPTAFELAHGKPLWEACSQSPEYSAKISDGIASDGSVVTKLILRDSADVFRGLKSLVDVAGGAGTMSRAIAKAFPDMKCTVLDLPHVAENVVVGDRLESVGGDMFEFIPPANAALLKWIMHAFNDEECVKILKKCKEAIPSKEEGGKVIIIDMVVNLNVAPDLVETQYLFDLHMMAHTTGKQRNEAEFRKLFNDAGFSDCKFSPDLGLRSIIEVFP